MARRNRGTIYAGIHHVWRRTAGPVEMFRDDVDRTDFCNRLSDATRRFGWSCLSVVLMPTHFHLLLDLEENALQPGMHRLFGTYVQQFNRRWGRSGHLKGGPYKHRPIEDDRDLLGIVRYIARNPVKDRLCEKPQDWYWSSYRGSAGYATAFPFVDDRLPLGALDEDRARASQLLRALVEPE